MRIPSPLCLLACASASMAAPADSVVAPPPPSAVYVLVHKFLSPPEPESEPEPGQGNLTVNTTDPAKAMLPVGESPEIAREVEYVIAGTTASMMVRQGGRTVSAQYYVGPYAITRPGDEGRPRVSRARGEGLDEANHFRVAYPYTMVFRSQHMKGRVQLEGRPAILYEIPDSERSALQAKINKPAKVSSKNPGNAEQEEENAEVGEEIDESRHSEILYAELEARRLWLEEGTRRPLMVETEDEVIRYLHKGPGPAKVNIPAECMAALKRYMDLTRVKRAKPYN